MLIDALILGLKRRCYNKQKKKKKMLKLHYVILLFFIIKKTVYIDIASLFFIYKSNV